MSLIANYGLFWRRDLVEWGGRGAGRKGRLTGYARRDKEVDFRGQAGIYLLFDGPDISSLTLMYIGQAGRGKGKHLYDRLHQHRNDHLWNRWRWFSWFGVYSVGANGDLIHRNPTKKVNSTVEKVLDHLEGVLITLLEPGLNKQGARWAREATEYYQTYDDEPWLVRPAVDELANRVQKVADGVDAIQSVLQPKTQPRPGRK